MQQEQALPIDAVFNLLRYTHSLHCTVHVLSTTPYLYTVICLAIYLQLAEGVFFPYFSFFFFFFFLFFFFFVFVLLTEKQLAEAEALWKV